MKEKKKILFLCMIVVANAAIAQFSPIRIAAPYINPGNVSFNKNVILTAGNSVLPANFSTAHLGFFCKKELKFESVTVSGVRKR